MSARRSRQEILAKILEIASRPGGAAKTYIMYQSNLSHKLVQEYLDFAVEKKFLDVCVMEKSKKRRLFKTNTKGSEFIKKFREIDAILAA